MLSDRPARTCSFVSLVLTCLAAPRASAIESNLEEPPPDLHAAQVSTGDRQLDLRKRDVVIFSTELPVPARERIAILDAKGAAILTLVDAERPAGRFTDAWDGRGAQGRRLRDGLYTWIATLSAGRDVVTIDRSGEVDGGAEVKAHPDYEKFDPFHNVPLRFDHTFDQPGEIGLVFSQSTYTRGLSCDPPSFCRWIDEFQPAGAFSYEWAGVDDTGALRDDIHAIYVISRRDKLSRNAIVLFGGKPKVSNVTVSPAYYRPELGRQSVAFALETFEEEPVSAEVTLVNQESRSVLRTIRLGEVAPGTVTTHWDGRANDGQRVAPGQYTVTVTITDQLGHRSIGQILTLVDY